MTELHYAIYTTGCTSLIVTIDDTRVWADQFETPAAAFEYVAEHFTWEFDQTHFDGILDPETNELVDSDMVVPTDAVLN